MRTEKQIRAMLKRMKVFEKNEGKVIEEMYGEMLALEYVLGKRNNLF